MQHPAPEQSGLRCQLCALEAGRLAAGERVLGTRVIAHVDPDLIVLVGPRARDVLVAPRRHLVGLSTTPGMAAPALSAMRVVADVLRSTLGAPGATIEPTLEIGGAGHVGFRVVPTATGTGGATPPPDVGIMVTLLAGAFDKARG